MILTLFHMDLVMVVLVILVELSKHLMESQFAIKSQAIAIVNQTSLARIVMNVKMDSGTLQVEKDVTVANAIQLEHTTHLVTLTLVSVSASLESLDYVATSAKLISMVSQLKDVSRVTVMSVDRRALSAMKMVNVHVTIMLKVALVIDAKKTNTTDIKDVLTVQHVTTWFKMQSTSTVTNSQHSIMF